MKDAKEVLTHLQIADLARQWFPHTKALHDLSLEEVHAANKEAKGELEKRTAARKAEDDAKVAAVQAKAKAEAEAEARKEAQTRQAEVARGNIGVAPGTFRPGTFVPTTPEQDR